jgi:HAD superfamily hydrolase (TIGR01509 family)
VAAAPTIKWLGGRRRTVRRTVAARSALPETSATAALVLDLGGVVLPTLFEANSFDGFAGPFGDDAAYAAVERGDLEERDYWTRLQTARPDVDVKSLWLGSEPVRPEIETAIRKLGGRVKIAALTNDMGHWFGPDWLQSFPLVAAFDCVVESAQFGLMKPDPEVFLRTAELIGEAPDRCLFVDDLPANLVGAREAGMQAILFDVADPAGSVRRMLDELGVGGCDPPPAPPANGHRGNAVFRLPGRPGDRRGG